MNARVLRVRVSKSLAKRPQRSIQEAVWSTTQRLAALETLRRVRTFDDLNRKLWQRLRQCLPELRSMVAAVGEKIRHERENSVHRRHRKAPLDPRILQGVGVLPSDCRSHDLPVNIACQTSRHPPEAPAESFCRRPPRRSAGSARRPAPWHRSPPSALPTARARHSRLTDLLSVNGSGTYA